MEQKALHGSDKHLGTILCKYCGEMIDTLDTRKVVIYYSICGSRRCRAKQEIEQTGESKQ